MIDLKIKEVRVFLQGNGTDEIEIRTALPSPIAADALVEHATFSSHVTRNRGVQWVRDNLGIEPTIFNPFRRPLPAPGCPNSARVAVAWTQARCMDGWFSGWGLADSRRFITSVSRRSRSRMALS